MELEAGILKCGARASGNVPTSWPRSPALSWTTSASGSLRSVRVSRSKPRALAETERPTTLDAPDLLVAGTAKAHGLTVLANNLRHFEPTGVPVLDPLDALPPDVSPSGSLHPAPHQNGFQVGSGVNLR